MASYNLLPTSMLEPRPASVFADADARAALECCRDRSIR
jgi:hypothetical protein